MKKKSPLSTKNLTPSQKRAKRKRNYDMRLIAKLRKPRKLTTAQQLQYLHDRITMLAGRLERRTPGGVEAQLALAARELQRRTDDLMVAADVFAQRPDRLAADIHSLRLRVEGLYPLLARLLQPPEPEPARPNGAEETAE